MNDEYIGSATRVGVIICDCGGKISTTLDTEKLRQQASEIPEVVYATRDSYPCSKDGQARLCKAIAEQRLNRVLIAGCTPRLVEKLFQQAVQPTGLDASYINVADIREQVTYVHADDPLALSKAAEIIEMGVSRLVTTTALIPHSGRVVKSALIIGGGLSALTVALVLADGGIKIILVEHSNSFSETVPDLQEHTRQLVNEKIQLSFKAPNDRDTLLCQHHRCQWASGRL